MSDLLLVCHLAVLGVDGVAFVPVFVVTVQNLRSVALLAVHSLKFRVKKILIKEFL